MKKKGKEIECTRCGEEKYVKPSRLKFETYFCSRTCYTQHQKDNAFRLTCVICEKEFTTQPAQLKYRNRKTCSRECRGKLRSLEAERRNAENPPSKGILNRRVRYSKKMQDWRKAVFERDDYTCQKCNKRGGILNADHIKPFAEYVDLRFELSNGRTLCLECHRKTPTWGRQKK